MADIYVKLSELSRPSTPVNDSDVVFISQLNNSENISSAMSISDLRDLLNFETAFETTTAGLAATTANQIFYVYTDGLKLAVNPYYNRNGIAEAVVDDKGNSFKYSTPTFVQQWLTYYGYSLIKEVPSFDTLRSLPVIAEGQKIKLKGYYSDSITGGGEFIGRLGTGIDDGGITAAGNGYYWERVFDGKIDIEFFGALKSASAESNTLSIQNAINYAYKNKKYSTIVIPPSPDFYSLNKIYLPSGITIKGLNGTTNAFFGATIFLDNKRSVEENSPYNPDIVFEGLRCKRSFFNLYSETVSSVSAGFMNILFKECILDGTSKTGGGKIDGDCITIKNVTFDVHVENTYISNYNGSAWKIVVDNAGTGYNATGVFSTITGCKFYNCGYGIYIEGAAEDHTDVHLTNTLLDHNGSNVYVDYTNKRKDGMGQVHIYLTNCRFEWATDYAIYNMGGYIWFLGWSLSPSSTSQKIFTDHNGQLFFRGRVGGVFSGNKSSKIHLDDGDYTQTSIPNGIFPYTKVNLMNTNPLSKTKTLDEIRFGAYLGFGGPTVGFKVRLEKNHSTGTAQKKTIGSQISNVDSSFINDQTATTVTENSLISDSVTYVYNTTSSTLNVYFGPTTTNCRNISWVGHVSIRRNATGTFYTLDAFVSDDGTSIGFKLFDINGKIIDLRTLYYGIDFSFDVLLDTIVTY